MALVAKNLPANARDIRDAGLSQEDPLEPGVAACSSILAPLTFQVGKFFAG